MRLALDVMGGDHAPAVTVAGAVEAARSAKCDIILVGPEDIVRAELAKHNTEGLIIEVQHASEVIGMDESPAQAIRQKRDSSLAVCAKLVAEGKAQAMVSAGNTGATMGSALLYMRRLPGVSRPAVVTLFPTINGMCCILDVGANVDCKPRHLLQFAVMGRIYMEEIIGIPNPKIGLLSIGEEDTKGNELSLATFDLLKKSGLNFVGNIEGRDIPKAKADVVVCDGFVGNVVLKFGEGVAEMIFKVVKDELKAHPVAWLSLPFLWMALKDLRKKVDYTEHGGAPLLGVDGVCIIGHGSSNAKAIKNALIVAKRFAEKNVNRGIASEIAKYDGLIKQSDQE